MGRLADTEGTPDVSRQNLAATRQGTHGRHGNRNAQRLHVVCEVGAGLFHDVELLHGCREVMKLLRRQRPGDTELQRGCFRQRLPHMVVEGAGTDDADIGAAHLDTVEVRLLCPGDERILALVCHGAALHGEGRHHDILLRVGLIGTGSNFCALAFDLDHRPGMGDPHRLVEHHRRIEPLGEIECLLCKGIHLLRVRRIEAGNAREGCIVPRILLVLRAVAGRIVCHEENEAAVHACIGNRHEGVCGDVQSYVLHGSGRANASHGGTDCDFERYLLVRRPLAGGAILLDQVLEHLGRRRAGVARAYRDACLPEALGGCLVARKKLLCHISLSCLPSKTGSRGLQAPVRHSACAGAAFQSCRSHCAERRRR